MDTNVIALLNWAACLTANNSNCHILEPDSAVSAFEALSATLLKVCWSVRSPET